MQRCAGCMREFDDNFNVCPHCGFIVGTEIAPEKYHASGATQETILRGTLKASEADPPEERANPEQELPKQPLQVVQTALPQTAADKEITQELPATKVPKPANRALRIGVVAAVVILAVVCIVFFANRAKTDKAVSNTQESAYGSAQTAAYAEMTAAQETTASAAPAQDWRSAYRQFLDRVDNYKSKISVLKEAAYAYAEIDGLDCPVMVLYDGWGNYTLYSCRDGQVTPAYTAARAESVLQRDGKLYIFCRSGSPATERTFEIAAKENTVTGEEIASAMYLSAIGRTDVYSGRNGESISAAEYEKLNSSIRNTGTPLEFLPLQNAD